MLVFNNFPRDKTFSFYLQPSHTLPNTHSGTYNENILNDKTPNCLQSLFFLEGPLASFCSLFRLGGSSRSFLPRGNFVLIQLVSDRPTEPIWDIPAHAWNLADFKLGFPAMLRSYLVYCYFPVLSGRLEGELQVMMHKYICSLHYKTEPRYPCGHQQVITDWQKMLLEMRKTNPTSVVWEPTG